MKRKMLLSALVAASSVSSSVLALDKNWWCFDPYIGVDAQVRYMDFERDYGGNLFNKNFFQGNPYIGAKLNPYMGVELGFEAGVTRMREVTLVTGDVVTGMPIPPQIRSATYRSRSTVNGPHVDLVGFYPLKENMFQLIGSIGISFLKASFERRTTQLIDNTGSILPSTMVRTFSRYQGVLRLVGGLQYQINDNWSVRGTVGWANTKRIKTLANDQLPEAAIKPKDSWFGGLGILWIY